MRKKWDLVAILINGFFEREPIYLGLTFAKFTYQPEPNSSSFIYPLFGGKRQRNLKFVSMCFYFFWLIYNVKHFIYKPILIEFRPLLATPLSTPALYPPIAFRLGCFVRFFWLVWVNHFYRPRI